jgi:hypothetical protein
VLAARQEVRGQFMILGYSIYARMPGRSLTTFTQTWPSATYDTAWPTRRLQPSIDNELISRLGVHQ